MHRTTKKREMVFAETVARKGLDRSGSRQQAANSRWWNPGERRERRGPVLPVGVRLTRRVREEYLVYFDRNATQSAAKRRGSGGMHRRSSPHRENWAAWVSPQAANSLWWNPGERRERRGARLTRRVREEYLVYFDRNATQSAAKRRGSGGMHRRSSPHRENWAAWVSPQAANSRWWNPGERRERGGARLTRRVREEYLVYFDRNATQSAAKRRGSAGMHRRSSPHRENWAAWVSPQAVKSGSSGAGRRQPARSPPPQSARSCLRSS